MDKLVTVITCTGHRPEAFELCTQYLLRQKFPKERIQWIIIDDSGSTPKVNASALGDIEIRKGPRLWEPGLNTQRFNLEEAVKRIAGDYILFMEDDDWYHQDYIKTMVTLLEHNDIVGEGNAKYYNLKLPGYKVMSNYAHASLAQTGFTKKVLPHFIKAINTGELFIDIVLWNYAIAEQLKMCIFSNRILSVGIKGVPGRVGIGSGHTARDFQYDAGLLKLTEWIKADVNLYKGFMQKKVIDTKQKRN